MPRQRFALTHEEVALLLVATIFQCCAIRGCRIGCAAEPPQQISPNRMVQMIFRQINGIDQLERRLSAVYLRYSYGPIQCNNRAWSNGHELIVKLQNLPPICALN